MKTLELWMPPNAANNQDKELWDQILAPFEKERGVDVKVTIVPWDSYETSYMTGISSGKGPDVGYMYSEMMGDYLVRDQLVPMDDLVTAAQKENFLFLNNGKVRGKQYALPLIVGGARILVYNKDLLKKAGAEPPTTWDEFLAASAKLKAAGIQPYVAGWGDPGRGTMNSAFLPFIWQAGGSLFNEDGTKTAFNTPEVIEAAKFVLNLKKEGYLAPETTGMTMDASSQAFEAGKAAMMITTEAQGAQFTKKGLNWGYVTSLKGKDYGTFVANDALVMLKGCKDKQLCYDLMSFILAGPQMTKMHEQIVFPPIGRDEKSTFNPDLMRIYTEDAAKLHGLPVVANGVPAYNALYKNLQQMLNGEKTPEQAMADAATEGDAGLAQG